MSKLKQLILTIMGLFLVGLLTACQRQKQSSDTYQQVERTRTIRWGVRADTRLFGLMNVRTSHVEGFEIDLARALTREMLGKKGRAKLVVTTADTRIPMLKNHNIDAVLGCLSITPQRREQVDFSHSYFPAGSALLVADHSPITNVHQLDNKKVIAVKGTTAVQDVHRLAPKAKVLQFDDYGQAMSALKSGQGVTLTTDNGLLAGIAKQNPGYKLVGGVYAHDPYSIAVNKGQGQMLHHVNLALDRLRRNGVYGRLLYKWFKGIPGLKLKEMAK